MAYKHLSEVHRAVIWHYHHLGYGYRQIASEINRSHTTVSRELSRNRSECNSWEEANRNAQSLSKERRSKACSHPIITEAMKERFVEELSDSRITPELFAGKLQKEAVPTVGKDSYYRDASLAPQDIFSSIPAQFKLSVTLDNGPEMALFYEIDPNLDIYFCNPYSSWEKGSVENRIQVVRLFIPKGTDIDALSDECIQRVENKVNNRPVELLNFCSPNQAFNMLAQLQLAA